MVLFFTSCPTSSLVSQSPSSTTSTTTDLSFEHPKSQPIPVRNYGQWDNSDHLSCSPLERFPSPLATSAESVNSIISSCSSRSSAERETERAQRRQLLNTSLSKLRDDTNMPLRKHLLIFNTVKTIQQDLDQLDDEDLYCSLVGMSNETTAMLMEVDGTSDECCWGRGVNEKNNHDNNEMMKTMINTNDVVDSAVICGAPQKQEERGASSDISDMMFGDDLEMEVNETKTWSWSTSASIFGSIQDSKNDSMDALFKWSSSCSDAAYAAPTSNNFGDWANASSLSGDGIFGLSEDSNSSWSQGATGFDMWGANDLLGSARFDMHNLLLLQA